MTTRARQFREVFPRFTPSYWTKRQAPYHCPHQVHTSRAHGSLPRTFTFFNAIRDERQHSQIADRAFEDKARLAMVNHLSSVGIGYSELSRTIKVGDSEVAEWEGVFELEGNGVYFLVCKHTVTNETLAEQSERVNRSMEALGEKNGVGKSFLAGEYWSGGPATKKIALRFGCGVLYENGSNLIPVGFPEEMVVQFD